MVRLCTTVQVSAEAIACGRGRMTANRTLWHTADQHGEEYIHHSAGRHRCRRGSTPKCSPPGSTRAARAEKLASPKENPHRDGLQPRSQQPGSSHRDPTPRRAGHAPAARSSSSQSPGWTPVPPLPPTPAPGRSSRSTWRCRRPAPTYWPPWCGVPSRPSPAPGGVGAGVRSGQVAAAAGMNVETVRQRRSDVRAMTTTASASGSGVAQRRLTGPEFDQLRLADVNRRLCDARSRAASAPPRSGLPASRRRWRTMACARRRGRSRRRSKRPTT